MAGNTYDIRLRGDAESVVRSFSTAGRAVVNFARLLGPGGVVFGALSGFKAALNPLAIGLSLLGAKFLSMARDGVAAFQTLERQAIQTTFRIHQSSRAMTRDLNFALGTRGGPGNIISGVGVGLQAGLSMEQSRLLGQQGARAHLMMGDDPAAAARRILEHAQAQGISYAEAGQQLYSVPPGVGRLDFLDRFAGSERARATGNLGQMLDPIQNVWQGARERRRLIEIGFWDTMAGAFSSPDEGYMRRGGQHSRGRRPPTFSADDIYLARYDDLRRRQQVTLAQDAIRRGGFDLAADRFGGAGGVQAAWFQSAQSSRYRREAGDQMFNDVLGMGRAEVVQFLAALGESSSSIRNMSDAAKTAAVSLAQAGQSAFASRSTVDEYAAISGIDAEIRRLLGGHSPGSEAGQAALHYLDPQQRQRVRDLTALRSTLAEHATSQVPTTGTTGTVTTPGQQVTNTVVNLANAVIHRADMPTTFQDEQDALKRTGTLN